ncbi:hypothetical protein GC173_15295 [bacterium]|nr:hypothetical protein [bacterium]
MNLRRADFVRLQRELDDYRDWLGVTRELARIVAAELRRPHPGVGCLVWIVGDGGGGLCAAIHGFSAPGSAETHLMTIHDHAAVAGSLRERFSRPGVQVVEADARELLRAAGVARPGGGQSVGEALPGPVRRPDYVVLGPGLQLSTVDEAAAWISLAAGAATRGWFMARHRGGLWAALVRWYHLLSHRTSAPFRDESANLHRASWPTKDWRRIAQKSASAARVLERPHQVILRG